MKRQHLIVRLVPSLLLVVSRAAVEVVSSFTPPRTASSRACNVAVVKERLRQRGIINLRSLPPPSAPCILFSRSADDHGTEDIENAGRPATTTSGEEAPGCWNPRLRKTIGAISALGAVETAYLTYSKLAGVAESAFCGAASGAGGSCGSVLNGPYSTLPIPGGSGEIPLALLGFIAYAAVAVLAVGPLVLHQEDDADNRIWLTATTTSMAVFSAFLMAVLFGVLKETCAFCVASAIFSLSLAKLSWLGGALPRSSRKRDVVAGLGTSLTAVAAAAILFVGHGFAGGDNSAPARPPQSASRLVADASSSRSVGQRPPPIATRSTTRELSIAAQLEALDAHFYGAFWCSHCYDQKEALGREAMAKIPYVECSKDGYNSQTALCKEKKVPGYPTWEINGKLYPGEQALEELEDIIRLEKSRQ